VPFLRKRKNKTAASIIVLIFALAVLKKKENSLQFIKIIYINKFFSYLLSFPTTTAIPSDKHSFLDLGNTKKMTEARIKI